MKCISCRVCHTSPGVVVRVYIHLCVVCVCVCMFSLVMSLLGSYIEKHRFLDQLSRRKSTTIKGGRVLTVAEKITRGTPLAPINCHPHSVIVSPTRGGNGGGTFHRTAEVLNIFQALLWVPTSKNSELYSRPQELIRWIDDGLESHWRLFSNFGATCTYGPFFFFDGPFDWIFFFFHFLK